MTMPNVTSMSRILLAAMSLALVCILGFAPDADAKEKKKKKKKSPDDSAQFTDDFRLQACKFQHTGSSPYFVLEPGFQLRFEGEEDGEAVRVTITVLNDTKQVSGVETRVVEEREWVNGQLVEISRNYFALCDQTRSVFYFGEDVDIYKDGKVTSHDGAWIAGEQGARAGLMMPSEPLLGAQYMQEIAPGIAMDRSRIVGVDETVQTPAGRFEQCVRVEETTPLDAKDIGHKLYCPGIGLVQDKELKLAGYGK